MIPLLIFLVALFLIACLSVAFLGPKMLLMPNRRGPDFYRQRYGIGHPSELGLRYEDRNLPTSDGFNLRYWILDDPACRKIKGAVIYLHGITDSRVSGLGYAKVFAKLCQRVYLMDMRRHGDSEGRYCTYGYHEKHDVVKLMDAIKADDPRCEITIIGVSMGAAIAIQTAAIDARVNRVIAVAPFYDLFSIALDHQFRKIGIRSKMLLKIALRSAERRAGFRASDVSPAKDMERIEVPVLIVHGDEDKTVKKEYSQLLKNLNGHAELFMIKGAGHGDVLEKGGDAYLERLSSFINPH